MLYFKEELELILFEERERLKMELSWIRSYIYEINKNLRNRSYNHQVVRYSSSLALLRLEVTQSPLTIHSVLIPTINTALRVRSRT